MSGHTIGLSRDLDIYIGLRGAGGRNWLKIEVAPMQKSADFFWVLSAPRGTSFYRIWFVTKHVQVYADFHWPISWINIVLFGM